MKPYPFYGYKKNKTQANKIIKRPHAVSDLDDDSDQTLFIVLESLDTPITKLSPFIIEKQLAL